VLWGCAGRERAERIARNRVGNDYGTCTLHPDHGAPGLFNSSTWFFIDVLLAMGMMKERIGFDAGRLIANLVRTSTQQATFREVHGLDGRGWRYYGQAWHAVALFGTLLHAVCGLAEEEAGLRLCPMVPDLFVTGFEIADIPYRNARVSVECRGYGKPVRILHNGTQVNAAFVPAAASGRQRFAFEMEYPAGRPITPAPPAARAPAPSETAGFSLKLYSLPPNDEIMPAAPYRSIQPVLPEREDACIRRDSLCFTRNDFQGEFSGSADFAAKLDATFVVEQDGTYTFRADCNTGCLVAVDGQAVITATGFDSKKNQWKQPHLPPYCGEIRLTKGRHRLFVNYFYCVQSDEPPMLTLRAGRNGNEDVMRTNVS